MPEVAEPDTLQRFVEAQSAVYDDVTLELREGRKRTHWMWFAFPQLKGLGRTSTADFYGIASAEEAVAYLRHPVLGPRLRECTRLLLTVPADRTAEAVLGGIDALKLRSCVTLFGAVAADPVDRALFQAVLDRYYDGLPDSRTQAMLGDLSAP